MKKIYLLGIMLNVSYAIHSTSPTSTDTSEYRLTQFKENFTQVEGILNHTKIKQLIELCSSSHLSKNNLIRAYKRLCLLVASESLNTCYIYTKDTKQLDFNQAKDVFKNTIECILDTHLATHKNFLLKTVHGSNFYLPLHQFTAGMIIALRNNKKEHADRVSNEELSETI